MPVCSWLNNNRFRGAVPTALGNVANLTDMYVPSSAAGTAAHTAHAAARSALKVRRAMCRRLGFNYFTGTLPAELYDIFTEQGEWWKKYERPPALSRPDEVAARALLLQGDPVLAAVLFRGSVSLPRHLKPDRPRRVPKLQCGHVLRGDAVAPAAVPSSHVQ